MRIRECVIPAAGASTRMGAWKPLLPWADSTIIETVVGNALSAGLEAIVIAGHRGGELLAILGGRPGIRVVENPEWEAGMLGSILRGAERTSGDAFFVLPADMPLVGPGIFRSLIAEVTASDPATLFAAYEGRPGHPVLIRSALLPEMRGLDPGGRLRDFLMVRRWRIVETGDPAVLADLDREADYRAAREDSRP